MSSKGLNGSQKFALCELLFAQAARCGYLEAGSSEWDGPDHITNGKERWTPFEAGQNMHGTYPCPTYGMAAGFGYLHGFNTRKRGYTLSQEVQLAPLPDGLLARARGKR